MEERDVEWARCPLTELQSSGFELFTTKCALGMDELALEFFD